MRLGIAARRLLFVGAVGAGLVGATQGCSTLNTTDVQCLSEAECLAKGPDFANTTCSPVTKTCVPVQAAVGTCVHNTDCIAQNNNQPAICRHSDNTCVVLQTPECPDVIDFKGQSIANDDTIVLGYDSCMNGLFLCVQWEDELKMIQEQFIKATGGIPSTTGGTPKPVIFVGCNELNVGTEGMLAGVKHLVDDIQVPIILGPFDDNQELQALTQVTIPGGALALSPPSLTGAFAQIPGNAFAPTPNFWRVAGTDVPDLQMLGITASDNGELQARYNAEGANPGLAPTEQYNVKAGDWKVLLVTEESTIGNYQTPTILNSITLNGKTGSALLADTAHFQVASMGNPVIDPINYPDPVSAGGQAVVAATGGSKPFLPNIVVFSDTSPYAVPYVVLPMEAQWPPGVPKPFYTTLALIWTSFLPPDNPGPTGAPCVGPECLTKRVFFTDIAPHDPTAGDWATRQATFFEEYNLFNGVTNPNDPNFLAPQTVNGVHYNVYDGVYFAEFLLGAIGDKPLTGANAAAAAEKFAAGGQVIENTVANIPQIFSTVQSGQNVTIDGLSGVDAFDPKVGAPPFDGILDCTYYNPVLGAIPIYTDYTLSAKTGTPQGHIDPTNPNCPCCPL
jgi:hypothetical protein